MTRRIGLTRPAALNAPLAGRLRAAGFSPQIFPLFCLYASQLPAPASRNTSGFIFVSPSAVELAWPVLQQAGLPSAGQVLAAIGSATAGHLAQHTAQAVLYPAGAGDAASLLALPRFQSVADEDWCLVQGDAARPELAEALRARQAHVHPWTAYLSRWNDAQALALLQALPTLDALIPSSSGQIAQLFAMAGESRRVQLQSVPMLVWHPRIADACRRFGVRQVIEADGEAATPDRLIHFFACPHHD